MHCDSCSVDISLAQCHTGSAACKRRARADSWFVVPRYCRVRNSRNSSRRNDLFFLAINPNFYRNRWLILLRYIIQFPFTWCQMAMGTEICFEILYLGALQSPRKIRASVVIKVSYVINEHDEKHR